MLSQTTRESLCYCAFVLSRSRTKKELKSGKGYRSLFYNFSVEASVTDAAGETHDGFTSLPLGTKEASLSCNIPEKNLRDSLKTIKFNYLNAAGSSVDGTVKYVIVPQQKDKNQYVYSDYKTAKANENVAIKGLSSGAYRLHAICGTDTIDETLSSSLLMISVLLLRHMTGSI